MDEKFIIVIGNPSDGFCFYGPFDSFQDAADTSVFGKSDSWVEILHDIKEV